MDLRRGDVVRPFDLSVASSLFQDQMCALFNSSVILTYYVSDSCERFAFCKSLRTTIQLWRMVTGDNDQISTK